MADDATAARAKAPVDPDAIHATLWEALAAAQASFETVLRSKKGGKGKYAPLEDVMVVRDKLNAAGLVVTQPPRISDGALVIETFITHVKTEKSISCEYPAGPIEAPHQTLGAGVTYARRYSLLSLLGIAPEDDDDGETAGNAAGRREPPKQGEPQRQPANTPAAAHSEAVTIFMARRTTELLNCETQTDILKLWARLKDKMGELMLADPKAHTELEARKDKRMAEIARKAASQSLENEAPF